MDARERRKKRTVSEGFIRAETYVYLPIKGHVEAIRNHLENPLDNVQSTRGVDDFDARDVFLDKVESTQSKICVRKGGARASDERVSPILYQINHNDSLGSFDESPL